MHTLEDKLLFQLIEESNELVIQQHGEVRQEEIRLQVEAILKEEKAVANRHKIVQYRWAFAQMPAILFPLTIALESGIIQLLLEYGADPNLQSDDLDFLKKDPINPMRFTALELACSKRQYQKAILILDYSMHKIKLGTIETTYYYLLNSCHFSDEPVHDISNPNLKIALQKLAEHVSLNTVYTRLNTLLAEEPCLKVHEDFIQSREGKLTPLLNDYSFAQSSISFYKYCESKLTIYPIWISLLSGLGDTNSNLFNGPVDVIRSIVYYLCMTTEYSMAQINTQKLRVFKNTCISLSTQGFQNKVFFEEAFNVNSQKPLENTIEFIKNIHSDSTIPRRSRTLIYRAWLLACESYATNSCNEEKFEQLMHKARMHSILSVYIKILTIMAKYDLRLTTYEKYEHFEKEIPPEDVALISSYASVAGSTYEALLSEIKDLQNQPHIKLAYDLAERHHLKFDKQNNVLIDALAQWVLKTKLQSNNPGFFVALNKITQEIGQYITMLNNDKQILVKKPLLSEDGDAVCTMGRDRNYYRTPKVSHRG